MNLRFAIVGDPPKEREKLEKYITGYAGSAGLTAETVGFADTASFLTYYTPVYDCVFINIDEIRGVAHMRKLRSIDACVPIVPVSATADAALDGYSVDAADFFVVPLSFNRFSRFMEKLGKRIGATAEKIFLKTYNGVRNVFVSSIVYIEVRAHKVTYHTVDGDFTVWGTLKGQQARLPPRDFLRCNSCYIINRRYIGEVADGMIRITQSGETIAVSRSKKREFHNRLYEFCAKPYC